MYVLKGEKCEDNCTYKTRGRKGKGKAENWCVYVWGWGAQQPQCALSSLKLMLSFDSQEMTRLLRENNVNTYTTQETEAERHI